MLHNRKTLSQKTETQRNKQHKVVKTSEYKKCHFYLFALPHCTYFLYFFLRSENHHGDIVLQTSARLASEKAA